MLKQNSLFTIESLKAFLMIFSKTILYFIGIDLLFCSVIFFMGLTLQSNPFVLFSSALVAFGLVGFEHLNKDRIPTSHFLLFLIVTILFVCLTTTFSTWVYDKSWDGMTYHQTAILEMSNGWNPFFETLPLVEIDTRYFDFKVSVNRWVNHYGKSLEYFAASMMSVTGSVESGKAFNIFLWLAAFASTLNLLLGIDSLKKSWATLIAIAVSLNPIVLTQFLSYYVDGAIVSCLVILLVEFITIVKNQDNSKSIREYFLFFCVIMILVNLKFTGLVYAGFFSFFFFLFLVIQKRYFQLQKFLVISSVSFVVAIAVVGFNPYVKNTINNGHPFYPLMGSNTFDIMSFNMPTQFNEYNTIQKLISSTFSRSDNFANADTYSKIQFKIPFTFKLDELKTFRGEATRLAGFGVFWSGIFVLFISLIPFAIAQTKGKNRFYLLFLLFTIISSITIIPESWWARYVPQFWILPAIACCFVFIFSENQFSKNLAKTTILLMIVNSIIIFSVYSYSCVISTINARKELVALAKSKRVVDVYFDMFKTNEIKLIEYKIPYKRVQMNELNCTSLGKVLRTEYCK